MAVDVVVESGMTKMYTCVHKKYTVLSVLLKLTVSVLMLHSVSGQPAEMNDPIHTSAPQNNDVPVFTLPYSSDREKKTPVVDNCEAFFHAYTDAVGNFTHCELSNAKPFRLCTKCIAEFAVAKGVYTDLITVPKLEDCKKKYLKGDRVQIIPTLQQNMENLWKDAHCDECSSNVSLSPVTKEVNYTIPDEVSKFLLLYINFTKCVNINFTSLVNSSGVWLENVHLGNTSEMCSKCKEKYTVLNEHYDKVWSAKQGIVCMDMVDMMNYTRQMWSSHLNCTHRTGDAVPVVVITLVVASTPLFFYVSLRITGKERRKKIFKQKRLAANQDAVSSTSGSVDIARVTAGGDTNTRPQRLTPFS